MELCYLAGMPTPTEWEALWPILVRTSHGNMQLEFHRHTLLPDRSRVG